MKKNSKNLNNLINMKKKYNNNNSNSIIKMKIK